MIHTGDWTIGEWAILDLARILDLECGDDCSHESHVELSGRIWARLASPTLRVVEASE